MEWSTAGADLRKVGRVGRVVKAVQLTIIDTETISPEMERALLRLLVRSIVVLSSIGIGDCTALDTVTAKRTTGSTERIGGARRTGSCLGI